MLRHRLDYVDAGPEYHERQYEQRALHTAKRRAAQLGYALRPQLTLVKPGRSPVFRCDNSGQWVFQLQTGGQSPQRPVRVKPCGSPDTPGDRALRHEAVSVALKTPPSERRATLEPLASLHTIREDQPALAFIVSPELRPTLRGESLARFPARPPDWRPEQQEHTGRKPRDKPPAALAEAAGPVRGNVPRGAGLIAGRTGRQWGALLRWLIRMDTAEPTWAGRGGECSNGGAIMASRLFYPDCGHP